MTTIRRSLRHVEASPDEIRQHCRAGYMQDLLSQAPRLAAHAELLLDAELDDHAIEVLTTFLANPRELGRTSQTFRAVHQEKQTTASGAPIKVKASKPEGCAK